MEVDNLQDIIPQDLSKDTEIYKTDKGTSTSKCPDYSQLHIHSQARIAKVYEEGEPKHGRDNWKNGVFDKEFQRDRWNHAKQHLELYNAGDRSVDHLAKVGWFCDMMMELERLEAQIKVGEAFINDETFDEGPTEQQQTSRSLEEIKTELNEANPIKSALSNLLRLRR